MGLGRSHCNSGSIGRRGRNILKAVRFGAESDLWRKPLHFAPVGLIGAFFKKKVKWLLSLRRESIAESGIIQSSRISVQPAFNG